MKNDKVLPQFGLRLKEAFTGAQNKEIAHKLGVSNSAITTYMNGRVPPHGTLVEISRLTSCSIHWLVTGEGSKWVSNPGRFAESSTHTIVLANQKGGVAKSTSATVLAVEFARRGYRTLLVDTPTGDCTTLLFSSLLNSNNSEKVPFSSMTFRLEMKGRAFFRTPFKGLDLCTSRESLQAALIARKAKRFTPNLSLIYKEYSFIVLDTDSAVNPFNNMELQIVTMTTPTHVLIPTLRDFMSLEAIKETLKDFNDAQKFASNLNVLGTFLTQYSYKKTELAKTIDKLNRILPGQVFKTVVREDYGIYQLDRNQRYQFTWSKSHCFVTYSKLADEILTLLGK